MEWISDYFDWALSNGLGGLIALGLTGFLALVLLAGLLTAISKAAGAFRKGWAQAGDRD